MLVVHSLHPFPASTGPLSPCWWPRAPFWLIPELSAPAPANTQEHRSPALSRVLPPRWVSGLDYSFVFALSPFASDWSPWMNTGHSALFDVPGAVNSPICLSPCTLYLLCSILAGWHPFSGGNCLCWGQPQLPTYANSWSSSTHGSTTTKNLHTPSLNGSIFVELLKTGKPQRNQLGKSHLFIKETSVKTWMLMPYDYALSLYFSPVIWMLSKLCHWPSLKWSPQCTA